MYVNELTTVMRSHHLALALGVELLLQDFVALAEVRLGGIMQSVRQDISAVGFATSVLEYSANQMLPAQKWSDMIADCTELVMLGGPHSSALSSRSDEERSPTDMSTAALVQRRHNESLKHFTQVTSLHCGHASTVRTFSS